MDYNSCLTYLCARGIADTKKTYHKWTLKGHPDKGGNAEEFKQVRNCIEDVIKQDTWSCDVAPAAAAAGAGAGAGASAASVQAAFDAAAAAAAAFYTARRSQPKQRTVSETFQELKTMFDSTNPSSKDAGLKYTSYTKYVLSIQNRTNLEMQQVQNLFKSGAHAKAEEFIKEMQNRNAAEIADALRYFNALGVSWPEKLAKWPPAKPYNVPYDRSHPFLRIALLEINSINSILMEMLPAPAVWTGGQYDSDFMQLAANNLLQTILWARIQNHAWVQLYTFGRNQELWLDFFFDPTKWSSLSQWRKFQTWTTSSNADPNGIRQFPEVFAIQQEDIEYLQKLETERDEELKERLRGYERERLRAEAKRARYSRKREASPVRGSAAAAAGAGPAAGRERSRSPERRKEIIDKAGLSRDTALDLFHLSKHKDETGWQLKLGSQGYWYFYQPGDRTKSFYAQDLL